MNNETQNKIKADFSRVTANINKLTDAKLLTILANNINKYIKQHPNYAHFSILADNAIKKANSIKLKQVLPQPLSDSKLEKLAYESVFKTALELNIKPSNRVIYQQLNRYGYAQTLVKQVCKSVGNKVYQSLSANGLMDITAEHFVFNNALHLIPNTVKQQLTNLFGQTEFAHA